MPARRGCSFSGRVGISKKQEQFHGIQNKIQPTHHRDVRQWIQSLDMMLAEKPLHAVPGHTLPLIGEVQTVAVLTNYRDAIQYVFDATMEGRKKGFAYAGLTEEVSA